MKRALVFGLLIGAGAALHLSQAFGEAGWTTILDGKSLDGWTKIGDANWRAEDGAVVADKTATKGNSFLVSKNSYGDVMICAEFWASDDANSGVYFRCSDPNKITDKTCYEANIYDQREDQTYATGGIVHRGAVKSPTKAGGKWNTYDITMKGSELVVRLNGVETSRINNTELPGPGPITLQFGNRPPKGDPGGAIKWRKVRIKEL
jgi:hypothetical protein